MKILIKFLGWRYYPIFHMLIVFPLFSFFAVFLTAWCLVSLGWTLNELKDNCLWIDCTLIISLVLSGFILILLSDYDEKENWIGFK